MQQLTSWMLRETKPPNVKRPPETTTTNSTYAKTSSTMQSTPSKQRHADSTTSSYARTNKKTISRTGKARYYPWTSLTSKYPTAKPSTSKSTSSTPETISDTANTSKMPGGTLGRARNGTTPRLCTWISTNAQKKLDPAAIKKQQDDKQAADKTAADAAAAAKAQQDRASASNAAALKTDAAGKAQAAQATGGTAGGVPAGSAPAAPGFTDREFRMTRVLWAKKWSPLLTSDEDLMSAAAGPVMSMFMGKAVAK